MEHTDNFLKDENGNAIGEIMIATTVVIDSNGTTIYSDYIDNIKVGDKIIVASSGLEANVTDVHQDYFTLNKSIALPGRDVLHKGEILIVKTTKN
jgi:hypothetical protein